MLGPSLRSRFTASAWRILLNDSRTSSALTTSGAFRFSTRHPTIRNSGDSSKILSHRLGFESQSFRSWAERLTRIRLISTYSNDSIDELKTQTPRGSLTRDARV